MPRRTLPRAASSSSASSSTQDTQLAERRSTERLLDSYWEAKGVFDPPTRRRLVALAIDNLDALQPGEPAAAAPESSSNSPGGGNPWSLAGSAAEARRRLAAARRWLFPSASKIRPLPLPHCLSAPQLDPSGRAAAERRA